MTGIHTFLDVLAAAGVRHLFGNPGTTELPLNEAVATDRRFRYVLGLQEVPVVAMADGYAQASVGVGVVNVHAACGLGNAMGMLYNAHCAGTPLLVTAGQQDARLRFGEPVLEGDLVRVARPWTKWAAEVQRVEDLPNATRRAIQAALTPPTGPVFLSLPMDVQMATAEGLDCSPPAVPDRHVRPSVESLRRAADLLAAARNPIILAGSRVTESGGTDELTAVAELLGAPVYVECGTAHGRLPMATDHPLFAGQLPLWTPEVRALLTPFDAALVVGMNLLKLYIHRGDERDIPEHLRLVHLDCNPNEIGKNFPVEVAQHGDPKAGLAELGELLTARLSRERRNESAARVRKHADRRESEQAAIRSEAERLRGERPMNPRAMMAALADVLPRNVAVVEEAPTSHQQMFERLGVLKDPAGYFAHRGWALGWGVGCAVGVGLAWPGRPVLALVGDGAALYGIQGLWSAARYRVPVVFVVCNNARYQILRVCGKLLGLPRVAGEDCPGMDLDGPAVDFVGLARSLGVTAERVSGPDELAERARAAFRGDSPVLFDVPLSG